MSYLLKCAKMTTIKNFEELDIWMMSRELVNLINYVFGKCKDFFLRIKYRAPGFQL